MSDGYEWQVSKDAPWVIIDWAGKRHEFETQKDQLAFLERDQRMIHNAALEAQADVVTQINETFQNQPGVESEGDEQAVIGSGEAETPGADLGSQGNRKSRRRAARAANRKKASS